MSRTLPSLRSPSSGKSVRSRTSKSRRPRRRRLVHCQVPPAAAWPCSIGAYGRYLPVLRLGDQVRPDADQAGPGRYARHWRYRRATPEPAPGDPAPASRFPRFELSQFGIRAILLNRFVRSVYRCVSSLDFGRRLALAAFFFAPGPVAATRGLGARHISATWGSTELSIYRQSLVSGWCTSNAQWLAPPAELRAVDPGQDARGSMTQLRYEAP